MSVLAAALFATISQNEPIEDSTAASHPKIPILS